MSCCWQTSTLILMTDQKLRVVHDKRPLGPGEAIRGPFFDVADGPPTQDFGQTELLDREPITIARAAPADRFKSRLTTVASRAIDRSVAKAHAGKRLRKKTAV